MTLKKIGFVFLLFLISACTTQEYSYPVHFETVLNDRSILIFDVNVIMDDQAGLDEIKKKIEQVEYGMRIVFTQRRPDQVSRPKRIKSVMRKICDSQMKSRIDRLEVNNMRLKRYIGYDQYKEDGPKTVNRRGLTGQ